MMLGSILEQKFPSGTFKTFAYTKAGGLFFKIYFIYGN